MAQFLGVDPSSVRRRVAAFRHQGVAGLAAQPVPGRPPKLTRTQEKILLRWLADSPTEHGFATELWTGRRLAAVIEQGWDVRLNPRYLAAQLRAREYSPQKPQRVPRQRDPEAIARWLGGDWPRINQKKARRQGAGIAPIDESGVLMAPLLRRTQAPHGRTPRVVQHGGQRQKVSIAAALWLPPRRRHLGLFHRTLVNAYFSNARVAAFLEELLGELSGRWAVV